MQICIVYFLVYPDIEQHGFNSVAFKLSWVTAEKMGIRRGDEKMRAENKSLKDGKSMGKWKLNYFTQFFCSVIDVSFINCKSIH